MNKHTIETHKKNIFLKLEVVNNTELVNKAMILGIIEL
ncbi:helix-turn-helix transcriptional regulator [Empedobacter falsenii]